MAEPHFACDDHSFLSVVRDGSWHPGSGSTPYHAALLACHAVALLTFVASTASGNLSQVDKLWSILPAIYAWACVVDARTALMASLATLWSVRLTWNFHRRGGYRGAWPRVWRGDEDYRWEVLRRGSFGGWWGLLADEKVMVVFNVVFISLYQNYLLLYIAAPSFVAWSMAMKRAHCRDEGGDDPSLNVLDGLASLFFLASLLVESLADNQQYTFQRKKREWQSGNAKSGGNVAKAVQGACVDTPSFREYADGFCQSKLFAVVRKPMYAAEQAIWASYYLFSAAALPAHASARERCLHWSGGGAVLLCLLFQGSAWLTEQISISKYPNYREYRRQVPLFVPRISALWRFVSGAHVDVDKEQ